MKKPRFSQSQLKSRRMCQNAHYYKYVRGLERRRTAHPLVRGRIIHSMIEADIMGENPWDELEKAKKAYSKLFREERDEFGDLPENLRRLMKCYFKWYRKDPIRYVKVKGLVQFAEEKLVFPLTDEIDMVMVLDAIGVTKDKLRWLVEHKSKTQIPNQREAFTDVQSSIYIRGLEHHGITVDGVAWNYIKYKTPVMPDLLQSGELSRKKNIGTMWPIYLEAIRAEGLSPKKYHDMKTILQGKEDDFFVRYYLPKNDGMIDQLLLEATETAQNIIDKPNAKVRTISKHCNWCDFYGICQAELRGLDAAFIEKTDYRQRKKNDGKKKRKEKPTVREKKKRTRRSRL